MPDLRQASSRGGLKAVLLGTLPRRRPAPLAVRFLRHPRPRGRGGGSGVGKACSGFRVPSGVRPLILRSVPVSLETRQAAAPRDEGLPASTRPDPRGFQQAPCTPLMVRSGRLAASRTMRPPAEPPMFHHRSLDTVQRSGSKNPSYPKYLWKHRGRAAPGEAVGEAGWTAPSDPTINRPPAYGRKALSAACPGSSVGRACD